MLRIRRAVASLSLIGLFCVWFASAQDVPGVFENSEGYCMAALGPEMARFNNFEVRFVDAGHILSRCEPHAKQAYQRE